MAVKEGYKHTEVGVIPEDWEVSTMGQLGHFSKGQGISKDESASGDIPCIRYGEIYTLHDNYIKRFRSFISEEVAKTSKRLKQGDILFTASGETREEIGKSVAFIDHIEAYVGGDVIVLSPKYGNSLFYGYLFNSPLVEKQKASKGQGDAVVHISASNLSNIQIPLPPLPEQKAIATALSDIDGLINSLSKLIEKKKKIKQGAMQELLTGKKRLEGFSGEWVELRLGDLADIYQPITISNSSFTDVGYYVYGANGIVGRYDRYNHEKWQTTITCRGSTCGTVNKTIDKCWITGNAMVINFDNSKAIDKLFMYYYISSQDFSNCITGTGQPQIVRSPLFNFIIKIPPTIEEQTAIATILSDMDSEIEKLQVKLEKYKAIKQGMMQELLTGRIRLLEEA